MPRKRKHISTPIEKVESVQIPDVQKKHYLKLGYKPYLSDGGKIKWLSADQHAYEDIKYHIHKKLLRYAPIFSSKKIHFTRILKRIKRTLFTYWYILIPVLIAILLLLYADNILLMLNN